MAKKFSALRKRMSPEAQERARERASELRAEMPLNALRRAKELSQATIAQILGVSQPHVSKIEHSADLYVSTLRRYVEALGGHLEISAVFPEGVVRVDAFGSGDVPVVIQTTTETVAFEATQGRAPAPAAAEPFFSADAYELAFGETWTPVMIAPVQKLALKLPSSMPVHVEQRNRTTQKAKCEPVAA